MSYFKKRRSALGYAFSGLLQGFRNEPHLRIHGFAAMAVILAGFYFSISRREWFAVGLCIVLVICLELINSALEKLCDVVMPRQHPDIKYAKDVAAAAVLLACVFSVIVGVAVFRKYLGF